ncbi:amicyanin [Leucobacter zeae]|nr:amicyanin [Leucobacter zeae]
MTGAAVSRRRAITGVAGALGLAAVGALAACAQGKPEPVPSDAGVKAAVTVRVVDNAFEPAEVRITPDQAVRWVFEGTAEHDVVANDRSFVSELMREGEYTHRFPEAADFDYICSVHPEMRGVVRVAAP